MSENLSTSTNSVDSVEMQHDAAFNLGLYCLQKYSFRGGVYVLSTAHLGEVWSGTISFANDIAVYGKNISNKELFENKICSHSKNLYGAIPKGKKNFSHMCELFLNVTTRPAYYVRPHRAASETMSGLIRPPAKHHSNGQLLDVYWKVYCFNNI